MKKFIYQQQRLVLGFAAFGLLAACQEAAIDTANLKKKTADASGRLSGNDDESDWMPTPSKDTGDIYYPEIQYKSNYGLAQVTKPAKTSSGINHTFTTSMTKTSFKVKTNEWKAEKKEAQDAVRTWNDETSYTTVASVAADGATDALASRFMVFATSATNNKGNKITFSKPFPVIVMPAAASRYEELKKVGTMRFTANVSGASSFEIIATVTMMGSTDESITISIDYDIPSEPSDKRGIYYQKIPMFKYSEYLIDLKTKNLTAITAKTYAYDEKEKALVEVSLNYDICLKTLNGKTEGFNSCSQ